MRVSACITTRNRTKNLEECLQALWNSDVKPYTVVVSDDSSSIEVQQQNYQIVQKYPGTKYITGPRLGVCANRNNAVNAIPSSETDFVAFIDDDICVKPDFIARALERYSQLSPEQRNRTILSGVSRSPDGSFEMVSGKLSFRGYFCKSDVPESVAIHATLFPRKFFDQEQWDENIFFGYEDAELCLRALKQGYKIQHCPELLVTHAASEGFTSTLNEPGVGSLTRYEISIEAARLYIGIKRYKDLSPDPIKLVVFLILYFVHMTLYLMKRGAIQAWPQIVRLSRIQKLWRPSVV
ncbi:glycosyltransferase [Scytonema hofmannii PCC 7110]|uniref:Glycosyltransferase n=1 Tax=Scytonema hofmannii PCC 7110 TaxID=128403 RepID=A0A139WU30_9CYAN|nr:glycosyltransferase [Scytonema hofmannii]KYC35923.1 glycosyltransferase [Scytonema hofmannii PCC 7110]